MKLETKGVSRSYFRNGRGTNFFRAVEPVDFTLEEGSVSVIVGKSGSGKTTLINMLSGLLTPTEGQVLLDGRALYEMSDRDRSRLRSRLYGIIPQGQTGLQSFTVLENVLLPVLMTGEKNKTEEALALLGALGMEELCEVYSNELSGGELRRMSIARALINAPKLIIADEPTGDLDYETTLLVMNLLKSHAQKGASVLIVTHDKDVVTFADRNYQMEKGVLTEI